MCDVGGLKELNQIAEKALESDVTYDLVCVDATYAVGKCLMDVRVTQKDIRLVRQVDDHGHYTGDILNSLVVLDQNIETFAIGQLHK